MIVVITGATGTGKSKMAISLAKKLNACVVNGDAFQVYKELSIATAKPTPEMMMEAPHFLFDFIPINEDYSVAEYQADASSCFDSLLKEGRTIILAGGTGLYIRSALLGYAFPKTSEVNIDHLTNEEMYEMLKKIDPLDAERIHPNNQRRVKRALEIYLSTGMTKSQLAEQNPPKLLYDAKFFTIKADREYLYPYVESRVDKMFEDGLAEEVTTLVEKYGRTPRAFNAIGVKELFPYLDGKANMEECKDAIKKATRSYIKRQETFFRHQFDSLWIENEEDILNSL